ncbi:MAG: hypothetical protein A2000_14000 [Ignavibacteria bacterium GWB2_36_8]|nr:MAG: hypothetical protein A2000_14000 [Ignavibacteria bacterium GWB2_36_8]OGU52395.1 MAG: hypothetical protein A2080_09600 [Ignavibacteria bacterium GWC2_36_12]OGV10162.1 MAG: hypothetical protein A3J84_04230 [Ignavibacteria bacterium RIFOXYA2_FULL_37_17]
MKNNYDELELKKYEELYSLSKEILKKEHDRFVNLEEKSHRQFSLLIIILGFLSLNFNEYIMMWNYCSGLWENLFLIFLLVTLVLIFMAIIFYAKSISFGKYKSTVLNSDLIEHFKKNKYIDVIFSLSKRNSEDFLINNSLANRKLDNAVIAFLFTKIIISFIAILLLLYSIIKLKG